MDCADIPTQTDDEAYPSTQTDRATRLLQSSISNLGRVKDELGCDVIFKVPDVDDVMFLPRVCYPDVVRHCSNSTSQHALSDACDSYTALTITNLNGGQLYRNPHCALCSLPNGPDRIEYATDCTKDLPVFYLSGSVKRPRPPIGPLEPVGPTGTSWSNGSSWSRGSSSSRAAKASTSSCRSTANFYNLQF